MKVSESQPCISWYPPACADDSAAGTVESAAAPQPLPPPPAAMGAAATAEVAKARNAMAKSESRKSRNGKSAVRLPSLPAGVDNDDAVPAGAKVHNATAEAASCKPAVKRKRKRAAQEKSQRERERRAQGYGQGEYAFDHRDYTKPRGSRAERMAARARRAKEAAADAKN